MRGSGRLDTRLDTPPLKQRRHPLSRIARKTEQAAYRAALIADADPSLSRANSRKVADALLGFGPFYAKQRFREITDKVD